MGMAMRGLTHCENCGTSLDMNEFGLCAKCRKEQEDEEKERERLQEIERLKKEKIQEKENLKAEILGVVREDLSKNLVEELAKVQNDMKVLDLNIKRPKGSRYDEWFSDLGYEVLSAYMDGNKSIIINFIEEDT